MSSLRSVTTGRAASNSPDDLAALLGGRRLFIVSNRGPVHYHLSGESLEARPAAGGLATALSGVVGRAPLTWIAAAAGSGDRLVASQPSPRSHLPGVPRLRFVVVPEESFNWFYLRFSNPVLWFLQHGMWHLMRRPDLRGMVENGWMLGYRPVNEAFARVVAQEVGEATQPVILTQDYHLYLLPRLLRRRIPGALLQHFTHIPWPKPEAWEPLLPTLRKELCRGLLGADILGFQTVASVDNFLHSCDRFVQGARVDYARGSVWLEGHSTDVRAYPISIDPAALRRLATSSETLRHKERMRPYLGSRTIVRVDRLDPSKNIVLGFRAFGRLLERRPDLIGRVRFLAFLVPSRQGVVEYRGYAQEVWREVSALNERFGRDGWNPVTVFHEDNRSQAVAGMALADVLLVNPIADGMNLVAKEGPIVSEGDAVLVLSQNCGAHQQLGRAAVSVPPEDLEATAAALERALEMPAAERRRRNLVLRESIEVEDLSWWLHRQFEDLFG